MMRLKLDNNPKIEQKVNKNPVLKIKTVDQALGLLKNPKTYDQVPKTFSKVKIFQAKIYRGLGSPNLI